jgi:hypothetical protein
MRYRIYHLYAIVALIAVASSVPANTPQVPLHVGRIWTNPEYDGAEGWNGSILQYPAGIPIIGDPWTNDASLKRGWVGHGQKMGTYLFSTAWTDPESNVHGFATSYFFRSMNYDYPPNWLPGTADTQFNYLYPGGVQVYRRWPRPDIFVGDTRLVFHPGADTITTLPDHAGIGQYPLDIVDPTLVIEQTVDMWWRYIQSVELRRTQYAYPHGSAHQDYILSDITLTNNGISGTTDEAPVLDGQTLNGVVWVQAYSYRNMHAREPHAGVSWDDHGTYTEPFGHSNHTAVYFRDGNSDMLTVLGEVEGSDIGDPADIAYYNGHLLGNAHVMIGPVFVSESPALVTTNLTSQPAFRTLWGERGVDFRPGYFEAGPEEQRSAITSGDYQSGINADIRGDPRTRDYTTSELSVTALLGYGPLNGAFTPDNFADHGWTLGFGESVRIVQVMAAGGLDIEAARQIGLRWNERRDGGSIDLLTPEETAMILSGQDTVRKAMNMAYWNMRGEFPATVTSDTLAKWGIPSYKTMKYAGRDPFDVPEAPRPPGYMKATQYGSCIALQWGRDADLEPDHDSGVLDIKGYRIYRQEGSRLARWDLIYMGPTSWLEVVPAEGDLAEGYRYVDDTTTPGVDYWYSVVAYDDGTQNWAEPGVSLESSRWWTWTGYSEDGISGGPILVKRGTGYCLYFGAIDSSHPVPFALHPNAPNPFNPTTTLRFSIADADHVRLAIYDAVGRHVRTIVDLVMPSGEHEIMWDGADATGRRLGSGVYVYRLTATGSDGSAQTATRRMLLVR